MVFTNFFVRPVVTKVNLRIFRIRCKISGEMTVG